MSDFLTSEDIEQLEGQHDKIARMLAELDSESIEAETEMCLALGEQAEVTRRLGQARVRLRTIRDRRSGLQALLRRYPG